MEKWFSKYAIAAVQLCMYCKEEKLFLATSGVQLVYHVSENKNIQNYRKKSQLFAAADLQTWFAK